MSLNLGIFNYYSFIVECEYLEKTAWYNYFKTFFSHELSMIVYNLRLTA
jgi:hypothetical protein